MESFDNIKNEKWIKEACRGSADAFAHLYEEVYRDLYRFALYTMKDANEAEDVVSESVLIAYDKIKTLRKATAFKSWIFQITSNQCRKYFAAKQKIQPTDQLETFETSLSGDAVPVDNIGENLHIRELFSHLSDEERLIVSLSVFGKYNSREIGEQLALNPTTVRSKLSRAYEKLRVELEE